MAHETPDFDLTEAEADVTTPAETPTVVEGGLYADTVRELSGDACDAEIQTCKEGLIGEVPRGGRSRINLPAEISRRFDWVRDIDSRGAEADLCLVRDRSSGDLLVLKYYRNGIHPDPLVMDAVVQADSQHTARVIDYHDDGRDAWEVQEYYPLGSLRSYLDETPIPPEGDRIRMVEEIAEAIRYLHDLGGGISHRDIKPSNILVRGLQPIDLVLTDFGLAQVQRSITHLTTRAQGTWLYAAPEVHNRETSPRSDWFSLGAIVYELCVGRPLFSRPDGTPMSSNDALVCCVKGEYSSEGVQDERWAMLVDGLTTYDRDRRWGYQEVSLWLGGGSPEVFREEVRGPHRNAQPISFQPEWSPSLASSPEELAELIRGHWVGAAQEWMGRPPKTTLSFLGRFGLQDEAQIIATLPEHPDAKLVRLQHLLDPGSTPAYKGLALDTDSLRAQIEKCALGDKEAEAWLFGVFDSNILGVMAEIRGDAALAGAAFKLREWKKQANAVVALVPDDRKALAEKAMRVYLPELFQSAFELGGKENDG
ncbi:serine/threonine-protein kinase [Adlercreutzia aquisgranensis]|uniref:serine/threonine-protein kinase n=1 Tax=Adlercreutzia aquisgranensis TaxID=2941323 RepID=UPI0020419A64|nr:protein kinase [Adlercreutzia aquisgranensis]